MKTYILLRDNQESGPFTEKELKSFGLSSSDLIWIEGESTSWQHAHEIPALKAIAKRGIKMPLPNKNHDKMQPLQAGSEENANRFSDQTNYSPYKSERSKRRAVVSANLFGVTVLLVGVTLCAFVVKKMVESFDRAPVYSSVEAKEIQPDVLPVSTVAYAAYLPAAPVAETIVGVTVLKNDSLNEGAVPKKPLPSTTVTTTTAAGDVVKNEVSFAAIKTNINDAEIKDKEETIAHSIEEKPRTMPIVDKAPSLKITANDYKVGLLGGISDLELSVSNPSAQIVEKATVIVDFLKPNGSVIKSQTLQVENISPGGSKKITVPENSRGVKVRYRIVNVAQDKITLSNT